MTDRHGWQGLVDIDEPASAEDTDPDLKPVRVDGPREQPKPPRVGARAPVREVVRRPAERAAEPDPPPRLKLPTAEPLARPKGPVVTAPPETPIAQLGAEPSGTRKGFAAEKSSWREYKELIATAVAGLLIFSGVTAYQLATHQKDGGDILVEAPPHPPPPDPEGQDPPSPIEPDPAVPSAVQPEEPEEPEAPAVQMRMVSIVSTPPGANVEVNGASWGVTPIIRPEENGEKAIEVVITLKGFREFRDVVLANEAGHFTVEANLQPEPK
ncbi:MAG: PEGA domain-containing protein [Deltaproteobacteria bacterium]|nr:PEGA domain-containing protein [Deltaproteobacteria bacterium]